MVRKLYEFPAVTKVDGLPPAPSSYACEELYEVPGGDQVDGSPPAPVPRRALRQDELRKIPRRALKIKS